MAKTSETVPIKQSLAARGLTRVQIDMTEKGIARLEWLKANTETSTSTEVIRDSLKLREVIVKLKGMDLYAEDPITKERIRLLIMI